MSKLPHKYMAILYEDTSRDNATEPAFINDGNLGHFIFDMITLDAIFPQ